MERKFSHRRVAQTISGPNRNWKTCETIAKMTAGGSHFVRDLSTSFIYPTENPMKSLTTILLALVFGCLDFAAFAQAPPAPTPAASAVDRPRGPIPVSQDIAAARKLFDSWRPPIPPRRIIGNIYYVGLSGVSSFLITTTNGHFLIDSCFEDSVPQICRNVEQLGFRVGDIKLLMSSHAHVDHTGGHALMKKTTGARIVASAPDAHLLETGGRDDFSPFPKELLAYTPVKADQIIKDGEAVTLGGVTLTPVLTPGHTKGATTWTMTVQDSDKIYSVAFGSSLSIVVPTRLVDNPDYSTIAEDFAATFKKLKALPCDVFFGPHGDQFNLATKMERLENGASPNPFIDPDGWRRLIANAERTYLRQLADEKAGR